MILIILWLILIIQTDAYIVIHCCVIVSLIKPKEFSSLIIDNMYLSISRYKCVQAGYLLVFLSLLSITLPAIPNDFTTSLKPPPPADLGTAINFVFFTAGGAVTNTGISHITGNIGTGLGAISGLETSVVIGSFHNADAVATQCSADIISAYSQLNAIAPTANHGAVLGNGETLFGGSDKRKDGCAIGY